VANSILQMLRFLSKRTNGELATAICCAARELFEETGVLVARGGDRSRKVSVPRCLMICRREECRGLRSSNITNCHLDAEDFTFVGRWVTPPFSARRFDTWFFLVKCPRSNARKLAGDGELESGEWIGAGALMHRWERFADSGGAAGSSCVENFVRRSHG
jgi:8-oxo-dGTP pyrophosphatase MutT (NUDIX family)